MSRRDDRSVVDLDQMHSDDPAASNKRWAHELFAEDDPQDHHEPDRRFDNHEFEPPPDDLYAHADGEPAPRPTSPTAPPPRPSPVGPPPPAPASPARPEPVDISALSMSMLAESVMADARKDSDKATTSSGFWAGALITSTIVCLLITATTTGLTRRGAPPAPKSHNVPELAEGAAALAPPPTPGSEKTVDLIPYMARQEGCYDGSTTNMNALKETASENIFKCVRGFGGAGGGTDGQKITLTLGDEMTGPRWFKVTTVEVTAGWIPKVRGGRDEWSQHRVPKRIRCVFNDVIDTATGEPTAWDIDTGGARGPVPYSGPQEVLASRIECTVLESVRPAIDDPSGAGTASKEPTIAYPEGGGSSTGDDSEIPADATWAMTLLQVKGRPA